MSGGSMEYLYLKVQEVLFSVDTPERAAFRKHLDKVAEALHDIEWVDSGDSSPGSENDAIIACLGGHGPVTEAALEDAEKAVERLKETIDRARQTREGSK